MAWVFSRLKLILLAVFVGLVVAAIIEPVATWLEARGITAATPVSAVTTSTRPMLVAVRRPRSQACSRSA